MKNHIKTTIEKEDFYNLQLLTFLSDLARTPHLIKNGLGGDELRLI